MKALYYRITMKPEYAASTSGRRFWFEIVHETRATVLGFRVNREGDQIECTEKIDRQHLIGRDCIERIQPAKFDNHYGWLKVTTNKGETNNDNDC